MSLGDPNLSDVLSLVVLLSFFGETSKRRPGERLPSRLRRRPRGSSAWDALLDVLEPWSQLIWRASIVNSQQTAILENAKTEKTNLESPVFLQRRLVCLLSGELEARPRSRLSSQNAPFPLLGPLG